jgi:hypothetical protein
LAFFQFFLEENIDFKLHPGRIFLKNNFGMCLTLGFYFDNFFPLFLIQTILSVLVASAHMVRRLSKKKERKKNADFQKRK